MSSHSTKTRFGLWLATLGAAIAQESPAKVTFNLDRADVAVLAKARDEAANVERCKNLRGAAIHDAVRLAQICRTGASP